MGGSQGPVIEVRDLWKRFRREDHRAVSLRELAARVLGPKPAAGTFWALRGVQFEVQAGERLGIMGPNGSGKSTLLKVLAGVLAPTRGRVTVRGSVCPLVELGAGFHPDLSGYDNLFLNGAILGVGRRELRRKLPDIAAFSGVNGSLHMPLKRYSTGMQVRLGFAIAVHASPDILLMDEVLAVGDEEFQRRCFLKLDEFRQGGGTTVVVSHNRDLVYSFCDRVLWLKEGELVRDEDIGPSGSRVGQARLLTGEGA